MSSHPAISAAAHPSAYEHAPPLLEADCVAKRYGDRRVLVSASLRAVTGRVTALLGRNGTGKSTLLRITTGSIAPDSGYVRLRGETLLTGTTREFESPAEAMRDFAFRRDFLPRAMKLTGIGA